MTTVYCVYAAGGIRIFMHRGSYFIDFALSALVVFDWLVCLGQEIALIWNWPNGRATGPTLVYAFSRYMLLIQTVLAVTTNYQMSDTVRRTTTYPALNLDLSFDLEVISGHLQRTGMD